MKQRSFSPPNRHMWRTLAALSAAALITACGGGGGGSAIGGGVGGAGDTTVVEPQTSSVASLSLFYGAGSIPDGLTGNAAAVANFSSRSAFNIDSSLSIRKDFSIPSPLDFGLSIKLDSTVAGSTLGATFPVNSYNELIFKTPEHGAAQGSIGALVAPTDLLSGGTSTDLVAYLLPSPKSILQQTVRLPEAGTGQIVLSWEAGQVQQGNFAGEPTASFKVSLLSNTGTLAVLFDGTNSAGSANFADISDFAGQTVTVAFEARSYLPLKISEVSLRNNVDEFILNGNFQGGMRNWQSNQPAFSQNMTSGTGELAGLLVQRSVYVPPNEFWGRWVDIYYNPTSSTVEATVTYRNKLSSEGEAVIYHPESSSNRAISAWDADQSERDVGFVYGSAAEVTFTSVTPSAFGSDEVIWKHRVSIPPGGQASIVTFLMLPPVNTGATTTDLNTRATALDSKALEILNNFRTDPRYRLGMTQQQFNTIVNF